ncbi:uncharacterized protein KD926_003020 [Aspergillus affinis]|uniref:uncharacterized protein n=1 Tax=Aspergillus affinis TaxID=1070780 RepID=UPI0022FDE860|nr:uncharacterized protein KD926_003020 [Aspergillus affinis]KAI9043670.1 hypothetical protein KD926_003020 [Aspergillus affinis]
MRTAFIFATLATTLVALNPQAEGEANTNTPESSSLHVPQRASSPMVRVGEDTNIPETGVSHDANVPATKPDAGKDTATHVDNSGERPEVVTDLKTPSAEDSSSKDADADKNKHAADDKEEAEDESLPELVNKYFPKVGQLLFPTSSSSAVPSPTIGAAAAASAKGELFHFDDQSADQQSGGKKRAVAPQAAPAPAVTENAGMIADEEAVYRTVTKTETDCTCASSVNGVMAKETGASVVPAPLPVHSSNAVVATESVVPMPSGVDPLAATPTAATHVHAALTEESAEPSVHGVRTEVTSGSVLVHSVSTPAIRSMTRTVVASATPTAGVAHSAFVGEVASSSEASMPTGVDPQRNSKDEQLFTGGAAWTGPREMVVMGVTGFLAVMMML